MDAVGIWLIILVLLPFLLFFCRVILMAWKNMILSKRIKNLSMEIEARQGQLSTVSGSVDANRSVSSDSPSTSQQPNDAHLKTDLPPAYEEVMKHYLDAKAAAAASETNPDTLPTPRTPNTTEIVIEDAPPPQYNTILP